MFSASGSPDGVSVHRSPPYASKTITRVEESSPGITSPGSRLQLTLKSPYSSSKVTPTAYEKFVDPSPDWTLRDLQSELDVIANRFTSTVSLDNTPPSSTKRGISWRELSVTADFGRTSGPFRMSAFDIDSDSESSDEEEDDDSSRDQSVDAGKDKESRNATSRGSEATLAVAKDVWEISPVLSRTGYVESALIELERERHHRVQEEIRKRRLTLDNALREEVQREAALLARVAREKEAKCELARRSDKQDQRQIAELRDEHLSALQRDHELRSQFEARQIRKEAAEEEARRQEINAREERERQVKARIQAEKDKAEAEAAKRKAQADAAAAAAVKRAEDERKVKEEQSKAKAKESSVQKNDKELTTKTTTTGLKPKVAPTAAHLEESRLKNLQAFQDVYAPLRANPAHQKELKTYERQIIKYLQQIAATQEQVKIKSRDLLQLLNDSSVPSQFLLVTLGTKLLSQCEVQVMKLPSFAFALAQVIVNVASQVPQVMDVVLAKLHEVCIFTVPKYYVFTKDQFESDAAYYKALGYREEDGKLESTNDYVARMAAYMSFYGAMVQTEVPGGQNPHGLAAGWAWCARLLNNIPADRNTAVALEAFLKMAGFRLYQVYPKPFMRVMQAIVTEFIEKLKINGDADARAVVSRMETYLHLQKYLQEPEGRKMPATDVSSQLKA